MKSLIYLLALCIALSSCASHKKIAEANTPATAAIADGSSFEKSIFIKETHEQPGIDAEYAWIRAQYAGYKVKVN